MATVHLKIICREKFQFKTQSS